MELLFIRHGQGEHSLGPPESLKLKDAALTAIGIMQSKALREVYPLTCDDLLVMSPTRRTVETGLHWSEGVECERVIHSAVGPRMFPLLPQEKAYPCDTPMSKDILERQYVRSVYTSSYTSWEEGINAIPENIFEQAAAEFLSWCASQDRQRVCIVSHDGTITCYRQFLGETGLSRKDFLGETGAYLMRIKRGMNSLINQPPLQGASE